MSRQPYVLVLILALAASPVVAQDLSDDVPESHAPHQGGGFDHGRVQSESFDHGRDQSESFGHGRYQSESFGHGYDPYDDGREAWYAPEPYRGSWSDHADAYYGYGECHFLQEPVLGQWGEIVDYRRVRVCD